MMMRMVQANKMAALTNNQGNINREMLFLEWALVPATVTETSSRVVMNREMLFLEWALVPVTVTEASSRVTSNNWMTGVHSRRQEEHLHTLSLMMPIMKTMDSSPKQRVTSSAEAADMRVLLRLRSLGSPMMERLETTRKPRMEEQPAIVRM